MQQERTEKNKSLLKRFRDSTKKGLKWDKNLIKSYAKNSYIPAVKMTGKAGEKGLAYAWKGIDKVGKKLFSSGGRRGATENAMRKYNEEKEKAKKEKAKKDNQ